MLLLRRLLRLRVLVLISVSFTESCSKNVETLLWCYIVPDPSASRPRVVLVNINVSHPSCPSPERLMPVHDQGSSNAVVRLQITSNALDRVCDLSFHVGR